MPPTTSTPTTHRHVLRLPLLLLVVGALAAWWLDGGYAAAALITIAAYEIALSADNAVPMAGVAGRLHPQTRRIFLTVGLFLGVLVMRLAIPPLAVSTAQQEDPQQTAEAIFVDPAAYAAELDAVRPGLAGFGGVFLWLVFTEFLFNAERKDRPLWIGVLERPFHALAHPRRVQFVVAAALAAAAVGVASPADRGEVAVGGAAGLAAYALLKAVSLRTAPPAAGFWPAAAHGACVVFERALAVFLLLEVLNGSYSFSSTGGGLPPWERLLIAVAGVAIGAVFLVRLTRRLDAGGALARYEHLPAGAAYVLGVLGVLLWVSLLTPVPAVVKAWFGAGIIGAALVSSLVRARRAERAGARLPEQRRRQARAAAGSRPQE